MATIPVTDDYRDMFMAEAAEHLQTIVDGLLALEANATDADAVEVVFRAAHNLKSMAAAMNCPRTAQHVHRMETLMDSVRRGARPAYRALVDRMLRSVDETRRLIQLESGGHLPAPRTASEAEPAQPEELPVNTADPDATVRVPVRRVDRMIEMAESLEEWVARLDLATAGLRGDDGDDAVEEIRTIVTAMRQELMRARTVKLGELFRRYPRLVRDLGRDLDKDVALHLEGLDVELDRAVVERIAEPIAHLLRNAVDHGIEPAEEREEAGKQPCGLVRLSAQRDAASVSITVSDDGRGMDVEEIWDEAVRRGIVRPTLRYKLDEDQIRRLTLSPGFSTVATPNRISGHGVGLDVVDYVVGHLGGVLTVRSVLGRGSSFTMRLPATTSETDARPVGPTLFPRDGG